MSRPDISPFLVHFTKPSGERNAFEVLLAILNDSRLVAGNNAIRGAFNCVCFTEAPLKAVVGALINEHGYTRYAPFGIMFKKDFLYDLGGRPVIYGDQDEFDLLPEALKWRHVRFEPSTDPPVDFSWEREWRLRTDSLTFDPSNASIVVPTAADAIRLQELHFQEQELRVQQYSQIMDEYLAEYFREPYPWKVVVLNE